MYKLIALSLLLIAGCVDLNPTINTDVRYIFFGDSTTDGPSNKNYPEFLREKLNKPRSSFTNQGHSGENTQAGLSRLTLDNIFGQFPNAEFFFYWQGGNDISDFIRSRDPLLLLSPVANDFIFGNEWELRLDLAEENIKQVIQQANDANVDMYIVTYFPMAPQSIECGALLFDIILPLQAVHAQEYLDMLNKRLRKIASENDVFLMDVATIGGILQEDVGNYHDCNHLSESGNEIVAEFFAEVLNEL